VSVGTAPPGYFWPDETGTAARILRGLVMLGALWLGVRALPGLPDALAGLMAALLGAGVALPAAWAGAVRRGHGLGVLAGEGVLRALLAGPALRLALAGLTGAAGAGLLMLRLVEAGPALWSLVALALPLTWGLLAVLAPLAARQAAGLHARRLAHLLARAGAVAVLLALAVAIGLTAPPPPPAPALAEGAAPLVAEALVLARLWSGLEAFALGQAGEFGGWGRGLAALVGLSALAGVFWALASLAVALALPGREALRALGPASDAVPPPRPGWPGPVLVLVLGAALALGAGAAGRVLGALQPGDRPSGRVLVAAERIGEGWHAAGTRERVLALRAAALAEDAEARAALLAALDAGFAAMAANVETFLDDYYSLSGEYLRLLRWALGGLEEHLTAELAATLQAGDPFAGFETAQAEALAAARARAEGLAAAEAEILAQSRLDAANPARLRPVGSFAALSPLPDLLAADLARAQLRWGVSAGAGLVAAAMARRVVAGLASRGLLGAAARMAVRVGGLVLAFGLDYALVKLDEYQNRDEFRAAILSELAAQRAAARAAFEAP